MHTAPPLTRPTTMTSHGLAEFRAAASDSFVPLRVTCDDPESFRGVIRSAATDELQVCDVGATPHVVERTPELIHRDSRPALKVSVMLAGTGLLVQDGRKAVLGRGDIALYDTSRPYTLVFDENFRTLVFMFAPDSINLPATSLAQLTGVRVRGDSGLGVLASPFLTQLGTHLEEYSGLSGRRLAYTALDLLTTVFAGELGLETPAADPHLALRQQVYEHIDRHLATPLTPSSIAAAHYISTRHLHSLFHEEGTTVSTVIRTRRLERCRRDLGDPLLADQSVATIGQRWGFSDAAHFSRSFKAAYAVSPSEYRAR